MSVSVEAWMEHGQTAENLAQLPELLSPAWSEVERFLPTRGGRIEPAPNGNRWLYYWQWRSPGEVAVRRDVAQNGYAVLDAVGPESFFVHVFPRVLCIGLFDNWSTFLSDATTTWRFRGVCRHVARVLGADSFLLLPDSMYAPSAASDLGIDGISLSEMRLWLREHCGEPFTRLPIARFANDRTYYEERVYCIRPEHPPEAVTETGTEMDIVTAVASKVGGYEGVVEVTLAIEPSSGPGILFEDMTAEQDRYGIISDGVFEGLEWFMRDCTRQAVYLGPLRVTLLDWHARYGYLKAPWPHATRRALQKWREKAALTRIQP